jgi:TPR repeat protein
MTEDLEAVFASANHGDESAMKVLLRTARSGDITAMFLMGRLRDVQREPHAARTDLVEARAWYERAASAGCTPAQFALGNMFEFGEGTPNDDAMARYWYERAAIAGDAEAQMSYARLLETGRGGKQSIADAASWYRKATHQGHELAATNLALMHCRKEIADASDGVAFTLFGLAADKLDGIAHLMLAKMWSEGRGTEMNAAHALLHLCIASLLLPEGSDRARVVEQTNLTFDEFPALRTKFESMAADYVRERSGTGSADSPR